MNIIRKCMVRNTEFIFLINVRNFCSLAFGWCISLLCLFQVPIWGFYAIMNQKEKTWIKKICNAFKPNSLWGPNDVDKSDNFFFTFLIIFNNIFRHVFQCNNIKNLLFHDIPAKDKRNQMHSEEFLGRKNIEFNPYFKKKIIIIP